LSIVSNTSPILNLAAIGEIALLQSLCGQILVPSAVDQEIRRLQVSRSRFAGVSLPAFATVLSVQNAPLSEALKLQLHPGEAEAIALAVEQRATRLLVDEHHARLVAARLGVPTLGCLGNLLDAKRRGLIPAIRPLLEKLETQAGFWVGKALRAQILAAGSE
jgi:predicted nucleic acid-binding protein